MPRTPPCRVRPLRRAPYMTFSLPKAIPSRHSQSSQFSSLSIHRIPCTLRKALLHLRNSRRLWLSEIPCCEGFSGKFRRCWKMIPRFSGSAICYPCQGLGILRQGKRLDWIFNWPRLRERCWIFPPRPPQPS